MMHQKHVWLTSVLSEDTVENALVLAESLRQSQTTKKIAVITSDKVSPSARKILRKTFDQLILIDNSLVPQLKVEHARTLDLQAKIFALSLEIFEKCIFIGANSFVLENVDHLFNNACDGGIEFLTLDDEEQEGCGLDFFGFEPSLELCEYLVFKIEKAGCFQNGRNYGADVKKMITEFLGNNRHARKSKDDEEQQVEPSISYFSMKKGQLNLTGITPEIVRLVDVDHSKGSVKEQLHQLNKSTLALGENAIISQWLNIHEQHVSQLLTNPTSHIPRKSTNHHQNEPIAIIGMGCRFPGANSLEEFWKLLYEGKEGVGTPPDFRWKREHSLFSATEKERNTNAGFLTVPIDEFDAKFFGISPKDAEFLDPQARLLHEVMWEALENGGIDPLSLKGSHTGVYLGSWMNDYKDILQGTQEREFFRTYMGNGIGATAARLSFLLGLTGPNIATESGCSSAIVAVDLAVKGLRNGETNLAVASGVNLLMHPFLTSLMDQVISPDGRCKTFDAKADGFGRAEGCGVLVLKRLSDALRDRDHIWAVIRGSALSQEGLSRSLGTPTIHCESLAMQLAMKDAGVLPEQVSFVETHGTGTGVGDPMEVGAIAKAYGSEQRKQPLVIGSVKTNVGHTESCSGITGIIKTVLSMQHELIPRHLNFDTLNEEINLDNIPAQIPLEPIAWPKVSGQPRLAGVSSFGITGTDGHVILQETPDITTPRFTTELERPLHFLKISAKTSEALDDLLQLYKDCLEEKKVAFRDLAYTANVGRASFAHRAFLLAGDYEQAIDILKEDKLARRDTGGKEPGKICFLFTGQGSQYAGMAKLLYETSPVFRLHFDQCDKILKEKYQVNISNVLWKSDGKELSRTIYSQTSIFCVEYCLLKLWNSWGIYPDFVLGHSLGEFCAAVAAGLMKFEDALKLVAERSRLIDNLPRGSMLVIKASLSEVQNLLRAEKMDLDIAAVNSNDQTVVAGDTPKIQQLLERCKLRGLKAVILEATHAFHSRHMNPMLEEYRKIAQSIKPSKKTVKCQYISGMEGKLLENPILAVNADYWVRHTRERVSFLDASSELKKLDCTQFIEIGPQPVLSTFIAQNFDDVSASSYSSLRRNTNDWETILTSLGKLYLEGCKIDWEGFDKAYQRKKVPECLPFHPFHRKSFWVDCSGSCVNPIHPLIGSSYKNASTVNIFHNNLDLKVVPWIKDHCVGNRIILPGAGFAEMCLAAGHCVANSLTDTLELPQRPMALKNLRIEAPLELLENKRARLQVIVDMNKTSEDKAIESSEYDQQEDFGFRVKIFRQNTAHQESTGNWVQHATCTFCPIASTKEVLDNSWTRERVKNIMDNSKPLNLAKFYKRVDSVGLKFGELFQSLQRYWGEDNKNDEIVAETKIPQDHSQYLIHPIIIDAMLQAIILSTWRTQSEALILPVEIGKLVWLDKISCQDSGSLYLHAWWDNEECTVVAVNEALKPVAYMSHVQFLQTNVKTVESVLEQQSRTIPDCWEELWKPIPGPNEHRMTCPRLEEIFNGQEFKTNVEELNLLVDEDWTHASESNRLIYLYIMRALLQLGWTAKIGDKIVVKDFCETYKILAIYRQLTHFYFSVIQNENGTVEFNARDEYWVVKRNLPTLEELETEATTLVSSLTKAKRMEIATNIYQHIANSLYKILKGTESALQVLFPVDADKQHLSADAFYHNHPGRENTFAKIVAAVEIVINTMRANPDNLKTVLRVLEVGAGTGNLTIEFLRKLKQIWGMKFEFYYTDISAAFFSKAERTFDEYKDNFKFAVFNVEENGLEQGIPLNYFDMVIAQDVLHATKDLEESVGNIRQTLKPEGCIMFTETLMEDRGITFLFGLLEGYWRFTDFHWRPRHTCVGGHTWSQILMKSGFEYVHVVDGYMGTLGIVTAQNTSDVDNKVGRFVPCPNEWIFFGQRSNSLHKKLVDKLRDVGVQKLTVVVPEAEKKLRSDQGWNDINIQYYAESDDPEDPTEMNRILFGRDGMHAVIYAWGTHSTDQKQFALPFLRMVKQFLSLKRPPKLYVLTSGVHRVTESFLPENPSQATLFGMVKTLKNENMELFVRYVDLAGDVDESTQTDQFLYELAVNKEKREKERIQVAYRENTRHEPRFNKTSQQSEDLKLPPGSSRYQLVLPESKMINDLSFDVLEEEPPGEEEVEVATKAFSLNFRDILTILKPTDQFEKLNAVGLDFSGVITRVGANVRDFKVGDRICGINKKDMKLPNYTTVDALHIVKIPGQLTFGEAAALPAVVATSAHCLIEVAKLTKEDTVLIHTGSGGVGLTAIQIAQNIGARIITTAGNPRKRAYLKNLGIEHVFHSRDTSYQEEIMKVTNGKGVNVVLNSITGPGFKEATLSVCAQKARFIEMSKLSVWTEEEVKKRRPDVQYSIVDLTVLDRHQWQKLIEIISLYLNDGRVKPIPYVQFDALRIRQALQYFQKAKHIGKVVVHMPEVSTKEGTWNVERKLFNEQSTYLITGGLGGIGFEVCKWMLAKGATDIVLIGRSPPKPEVAREVEKLRKKYNVLVKLGDVGDYEQCKEIIEWVGKTNPNKPIRGIQHCAGVLRDNLYDNQTWEAFESTFNPKVKGTWNLHNLTKDMPLEHFVLYSSITALAGTPAQANHAAANCFEDTFAHYRHSRGLTAMSINWGQWSQVGCAKDINLPGIAPVSVQRMLNGLEAAFRSQNVQVAYADFESLHALSIVSPTFKFYLDKALLLKISQGTKLEASHLLKSDQFWKDVDEAPSREEKITVIMDYLKVIVRCALRMDNDEPISEDANMQELGVDSLMFLELKNSIQGLLGSRITVTANMIKDCRTIRDLATVLIGKICDDEEDLVKSPCLNPEEFSALLESDCKLDEEIKATEIPPTRPVTAIKNVLFTGVTGQLGPYVLAKLSQLQNPSLEKITCVIRTMEGKCPEEKLKGILKGMNLLEKVDMSKVTCVRGELSQPNFGLSEEDYNSLCDNVEAIFHLAVKSNHVENYRKNETGSGKDVRSVNVGGMTNVLRFASTGRTKHVFFASSLLAVFGGSDENTLCDNWPTESENKIIADHGITGYPASKYVCEMLLKQAVDRGIPSKSFRFPWIMGDSETGRLNYTSNHYILRMISYLKINAMPDAPIPAILLPVDTCADLSLRLFWNEKAPSDVYNIAPTHPQLEAEFIQIAKEDFNRDLEMVDWKSPEFVEKLYASDMPMEALKELYENVDRGVAIAQSDGVRAIQGYLQNPRTFFINKKVDKYLPGFAKTIPSSMDIVRKNLDFVRKEGFTKRFGIE